MLQSVDDIRDHNREILDLAQVLAVLGQHPELRSNPNVCELVSRFNEKVWMHLVFDDKDIYMDLLEHKDPAVSSAANEFRDSARNLRKQFSRYMKHWCHRNQENDHPAFVEESSTIFERILERVRTENEEILPLVEPDIGAHRV